MTARPEIEERIGRVLSLLADAAHSGYIGEPVSQLEHALQAAALAREAGAPDVEILAALLHDVGHLCASDDAPRMAELGVEDHEGTGAAYLADLGFASEVTDLVRAHVAAKRYLVSARPAYAAGLSDASRGTLAHQGGPMTAAECRAFEADPRRDAKLRVRAWDEAAKQPGRRVPGLETYRPLLRAHLEGARPSRARSGVSA